MSMVFGWFTNETRSLYVERPATAAGALIYLHPDKSIPRGTKITVRSDECALFFREGQFVGKLEPGTYLLDTANIPWLGHLLVDKFTGANQFITELFFVSIAETLVELSPTALGQYVDLNSRNVVQIIGKTSYTLLVEDPLRLVTQLGGQSAESSATTIEVLNGRLLNGFRKIVGQLVESIPVLSVVSNAQAEAVSNGLLQFAGAEFQAIGTKLRRVYSLELTLDEASFNLLREFGKQEAGLRLQSKGAEIASQEGFAEYNLIQGQRAALEGLGKGLAEGKGTMFMGMGLGGNLTSQQTARPSPRPPSRGGSGTQGPGTILAPPRSFLIQSARGEDGPFSIRQVALHAASSKRPLSEIMIRGEDDPPGVYFSADLEPQIVAEYRRRVPSVPAGTAPAASQNPSPDGSHQTAPQTAPSIFDVAFEAAISDGVISPEEISMLVALSQSLGMASDPASAKTLVIQRAASRGVKFS
jgi:membrane protease subunit (stomatin/prohibitin family)